MSSHGRGTAGQTLHMARKSWASITQRRRESAPPGTCSGRRCRPTASSSAAVATTSPSSPTCRDGANTTREPSRPSHNRLSALLAPMGRQDRCEEHVPDEAHVDAKTAVHAAALQAHKYAIRHRSPLRILGVAIHTSLGHGKNGGARQTPRTEASSTDLLRTHLVVRPALQLAQNLRRLNGCHPDAPPFPQDRQRARRRGHTLESSGR